MADQTHTDPERAFHERLLAAVKEVRGHTRFGITRILADIDSLGGLRAAKARLPVKSGGSSPFFALLDRPDEYFRAAQRVGLADLSVEAIVLEPRWAGLFSTQERDKAASRLSEHGFNPPLEGPSRLENDETLPARVQPCFAHISFALAERNAFEDLLLSKGERCACDIAAEHWLAMRDGRRPPASPVVRKHLSRCVTCRNRYPELAIAYEDFDRLVLEVWVDLLRQFQATLKLADGDLKRLIFFGPEDYEESGDYEVVLEVELNETIRPVCAWRAVRLGCHIGRFMSTFDGTFEEPGDLWLKRRRGEVPGPTSDFIRSLDPQLFTLGLAARNLLLVRHWPEEEGGTLWLPSDGDLAPVSDLVRVEATSDLEDWEEILGKPPQDLNPLGLLYLVGQAANAQAQEPATDFALLRSIKDQLDHIESQTRSHQDSLDAIRAQQEAEINHLERMVAYLSSTDRHACEQALLTDLPGVYGNLVPQARSLFLTAEQLYRTRDIAAPAVIVHALAAAFEVQLRQGVLPGLFEHLGSRNVKRLMPQADWRDTEQRPVYSHGRSNPEKFTLGEMERLFRLSEPAIHEYCGLHRLSHDDVHKAVEAVQNPRNAAAHGRSIDIGTAVAIRCDWLNWGGKRGGIFAVLFPTPASEQHWRASDG